MIYQYNTGVILKHEIYMGVFMINQYCTGGSCIKRSVILEQEYITDKDIVRDSDSVDPEVGGSACSESVEDSLVKIEIKDSGYSFIHGNRFKNPPKWIVVHYTACANVSAKNMCKSMRNNKKASTHFYVDENDIYASVPLKYVAWHVGNGKCSQPSSKKSLTLEELSVYNCKDWRYSLAAKNHLQWKSSNDDFLGNQHSIGVDLCVKKKSLSTKKVTDTDWYFEDAAVEKAVQLIAYLMQQYNIDIEHVIRHADATGKCCPQPFTFPFDEGDRKWFDFKERTLYYTNNVTTRRTQNG